MVKIVSNCLFASVVLLASEPALAQQSPDYIKLMSTFSQTDYAVSKCSKPDAAVLAKFNSNLKIVMSRGLDAVRKMKPEASEKLLAEALQKGQDANKRQIDGILGATGCSDPRIQGVINRLDEYANLKL